MKKLILAFIVLVASAAAGYSLYRFTDIFQKPENVVETVETSEIELVETVEKQLILAHYYWPLLSEKVGKKWPVKWADIEQMLKSYKILIKNNKKLATFWPVGHFLPTFKNKSGQ